MNKNVLLKSLLVNLIFTCGISYSQDTLRIKDYGLLPNTRENSIPYIKKCLSDARKHKEGVVVVFERVDMISGRKAVQKKN